MRVLLDHCVPSGMRRYMPEHDVTAARDKGWDELKNGDLLKKARDEGYEVFITADKKIKSQQNIKKLEIRIVELSGNTWPRVRTRIKEIREAVKRSKLGEVEAVAIPKAEKKKREKRTQRAKIAKPREEELQQDIVVQRATHLGETGQVKATGTTEKGSASTKRNKTEDHREVNQVTAFLTVLGSTPNRRDRVLQSRHEARNSAASAAICW